MMLDGCRKVNHDEGTGTEKVPTGNNHQKLTEDNQSIHEKNFVIS